MTHSLSRLGRCAVFGALGALAAGCAKPAFPPTEAALASISGDGLLRHIKVLASDEFEGRAPGTAGEDGRSPT